MPLPGALAQHPVLDPKTGLISRPWLLFLNSLAAGTFSGSAAPADAEYVVGALNGTLTAERLVTNTTSISWDVATAGQAKATRAALTGDVTASANGNATTIANDAVTYAKMQNVSAASRLLGRGSAAGSGDVEELTLGSGVAMTGTVLSATGSGGTVTTTGSPASGNLTKFSGAASITNGDLSGDVTTTSTLATTIANNAVSDAKLRDSGALSVIGRSANSSGDPADISAVAAAGSVLRESGSTIGFGTVATAGITDAAVTYAKIQDVSAASRILGRGSAAGSGDAEELTLGTNISLSGTTLNVSGVVSGSTVACGIVIDGAGSAITTGVKGFVQIPVACTIASITLLSTDASATAGSIVIDVWKDTYAHYPPTVADTITASAKPTLSSANAATDSTLTGWSKTITAGDILGFNVDSATTVTRVTLLLKMTT